MPVCLLGRFYKENIMLPVIVKYQVFPSVYPANRESEITVLARERSLIFRDGDEYKVRLIAVDEEPISETTVDYTVTASEGVLRLKHHFLSEQEYRIVIEKDETAVFDTALYALDEDLYELMPLMGDLHSHSIRSDGKQDPLALASYMRERGYDFYAMTDHHRYYPSEEVVESFKEIKSGLVPIFGEEVHVPDTALHVVHVGGKKSVDDIYVNHREEYDREILEYEARVPEYVPDLYKKRYARAEWASEHIRAVGGVCILPHPFWRPKKSKHHNVSTEFATIAIKSGLFDAYELIGAMGQQEVNASVAFWNDLRAEGLRIPVVGSSDVHSVLNSPEFPWQRTVLFAKKKEHDSIVEAVKLGNSVAVEVTGTDGNTQYRVYGSLRLVNYTQFLMRYYFAKVSMLSYGEGIALRAYFMGDASKELVEQSAALTESFCERFFGRMPPRLPSDEVISKRDVRAEIHEQYIV